MSHRTPRLIKVACVLVLVSLGLMSWAILHPVPLAVIAAMSLGQGIGILGVLLFALVALRDLKPIFKARVSSPPPARSDASPPAKSEETEPKKVEAKKVEAEKKADSVPPEKPDSVPPEKPDSVPPDSVPPEKPDSVPPER